MASGEPDTSHIIPNQHGDTDLFGARPVDGSAPAPEPEYREYDVPAAPAFEPSPSPPPAAPPVAPGFTYEQYQEYADRDNAELEYQEQMQEALEEMADSNPAGYADLLARAYAGQVEARLRAEYDQALAPIVRAHNEQASAQTVDQLRADFGPEVLEANKANLAAAIQADPNRFLDPATQLDRLREVVMAAEYARAQGIDWDARAEAQIKADARTATPIQDAPAPPVGRPGEISRTVHTEGGSGPQPMRYVEEVDPVIAEIRELGTVKRDAFGLQHGA
jgi:hypothetical protein